MSTTVKMYLKPYITIQDVIYIHILPIFPYDYMAVLFFWHCAFHLWQHKFNVADKSREPPSTSKICVSIIQRQIK